MRSVLATLLSMSGEELKFLFPGFAKWSIGTNWSLQLLLQPFREQMTFEPSAWPVYKAAGALLAGGQKG